MTEWRNMTCPHCGVELNGHTNPEDTDSKPEAGNISICIRCAEVSIYDGDPLVIRKLTPEEEESVLLDEDVLRLRIAVIFSAIGLS